MILRKLDGVFIKIIYYANHDFYIYQQNDAEQLNKKIDNNLKSPKPNYYEKSNFFINSHDVNL